MSQNISKIQDRAKLFACVEGQKITQAKLTKYTVYLLQINNYCFTVTVVFHFHMYMYDVDKILTFCEQGIFLVFAFRILGLK